MKSTDQCIAVAATSKTHSSTGKLNLCGEYKPNSNWC
jgi:hypothetical protein